MLKTEREKEGRLDLLDEYIYLSELTDPNESQQDRLLEILEMSTYDASLDELISQFEVGMLSQEDIGSLLDEQAQLQEHFVGGLVCRKNCDYNQNQSELHSRPSSGIPEFS